MTWTPTTKPSTTFEASQKLDPAGFRLEVGDGFLLEINNNYNLLIGGVPDYTESIWTPQNKIS